MIDKKEAAKILVDLCEQLNEIHSRGGVHLDIKEENIQKEKIGEKIYYRLKSPLGLLKEGKEISISGKMYSWHECTYAPEYRKYFLNNETNFIPKAVCDTYSLMVVYYKLLTGQNVPNNFQMNRRWRVVLKGMVQSWEVNEQEAIMKLFYLCTIVDPDKRIQNAGEIMRETSYNIIKRMTQTGEV